MKIAHKLYLVILISFIMTVGLGIVSYVGVKKINTSFDELVQFPIPSILRLSNMTEAFLMSVEEAHSYRLYGEAKSKEEHFAAVEEFDRLMMELKKELHYGTPDILDEDTVLIDSISEKVGTLHTMVVADFDQYEATPGTDKPTTDPFSFQKDEIITLLRQYRDMEKEEIESARVGVNLIANETVGAIELAALIILVATLIINGLIAKSITRPLRLLGEAATGLGKGELNRRAEVSSEDELGVLAGIFNTMADSVEHAHSALEAKVKERTTELEKTQSGLEETVALRTAELEKIRAGLEETVALRTAELQQKLTEMEKMNVLMTGRELKMVELKQELEELKKKLGAVNP